MAVADGRGVGVAPGFGVLLGAGLEAPCCQTRTYATCISAGTAAGPPYAPEAARLRMIYMGEEVIPVVIVPTS